MVVHRWQAPQIPNLEQMKMIFHLEGLEPLEEVQPPGQKIGEHRHPFTEVRVVVEGELVFNISGNQFLLRPGDRLEVPANTKHWHSNNESKPTVSLVAQRTI